MKTPEKFRADINRWETKRRKFEFKEGDHIALRFSEHHYIWHDYFLKDGWFIKV